jgi:hypothetical protein
MAPGQYNDGGTNATDTCCSRVRLNPKRSDQSRRRDCFLRPSTAAITPRATRFRPNQHSRGTSRLFVLRSKRENCCPKRCDRGEASVSAERPAVDLRCGQGSAAERRTKPKWTRRRNGKALPGVTRVSLKRPFGGTRRAAPVGVRNPMPPCCTEPASWSRL